MTENLKVFLALLLVGGVIGLAGTLDYDDARMAQAEAMERAFVEQQATMEKMRMHNKRYAAAIVACLNRRGFVLQEVVVLCDVISIPGGDLK